MPQIDLLTITARRAEVLGLVARHQTQLQIATAMDIAPATVKSHIDWFRERTNLNSMREMGDWWQHSRKDWLCELATAAGLEVGVEHLTHRRRRRAHQDGPHGRADTVTGTEDGGRAGSSPIGSWNGIVW